MTRLGALAVWGVGLLGVAVGGSVCRTESTCSWDSEVLCFLVSNLLV